MRAQNSLTRWLSRPINITNVLSYYIPLTGVAAHGLFTANIFSPGLLRNMCNEWDVFASKSLMATSLIGSGFFVFFRPHLYQTSKWHRVEYSVFSSVIYNFGTILLAIFVKPFIPKKLSTSFKTIIAFGISTFLASRTLKYLNHIDKRTNVKDDEKFTHIE
uniref:GtrA domain-containing protein n=1 Tax=Strongyloides venezuelensis TaxID=75913 RepID=A0A0K0FG08_STRVS